MKKTLETVIGDLLRDRGLSLATAESCTGGRIADRLTDIPGSSDYFRGSIVAYANSVKIDTLGVSGETLERYGAVSRETALEMARGARTKLETDVAVSVTGIAGPGGGLPDKPVGTTWIGLAAADGEWTRLYTWTGSRAQNKAASADAALELVRDYLSGDLRQAE